MSSVSSSSRPPSPKKPGAVLSDGLKSNPHPYAIKTTSTGILSRSTSTSTSVSHSHNHYVPISPSPSPTKSTHSSYSGRSSRHRYSRSLTDDIPRPLPAPPEDAYYQQQHGNGMAETQSAQYNDPNDNPKLWTPEQLAANVSEISDFVLENEITGRAFLRFDEGVLDAYGVIQQWQRSLILSASRRLRQSMLKDRIWPQQTGVDYDPPNDRYSRSVSPTKGVRVPLPNDEEDDQAYLSSSSISSISGRRKRKYRPNGRVNGMVASFERSSSTDERQVWRERTGSISSVDSSDEPNAHQPHHSDDGTGQPSPYPPRYPTAAPLLLPQSSFPPSPFSTPQATGNNEMASTTPQGTGTGRPLPFLPIHPSLRNGPSLADEVDSASKNTSGEITMDELLAVLNADGAASDGATSHPHGLVNTDRRKGHDRKGRKKSLEGAAAWEVDYPLGETMKRVPPVQPPSQPQMAAQQDDELSVEELLAMEDGRGGVAAWVNEPEEPGWTVKRVGGHHPETADPVLDAGAGQDRFGSISKGKGTGKGADRISLSAGRKRQGQAKQARRVGELFATATEGVEEAVGEEELLENEMLEAKKKDNAERAELERMREVEKQLLRAEEEERDRWLRAAAAEEETHKREPEPKHQLPESQGEEHSKQLAEAEKERQRQLEAEQQLAASLSENRRLLDAFRGRLVEVERRVGAMEDIAAAAATVTPKEPKANGPLTSRLRMLAAWALSTSLTTALPAAVGISLAGFVGSLNPEDDNVRRREETNRAGTSSERQRRARVRRLEALYPKTIPRYALLIGIGVCAYVLRGLLRWGVRGMRGVGTLGGGMRPRR